MHLLWFSKQKVTDRKSNDPSRKPTGSRVQVRKSRDRTGSSRDRHTSGSSPTEVERVSVRVRIMDAVYEDETGTGSIATDDIIDDVTDDATSRQLAKLF